ncbi:rhamnulose-1-phosphate aldolase [Streptomyces sp. Act143]|uniref:class II aldolase/adducin family protein n=1 Tax=Streptomyces sp. Act143 TaxID=2200760 RepID=UPI000D6739E9|nr:class II aldolase/adducin family protein [Streptomyces sp. Act143]PWI17980.1 rhamnulose-1-phosphate aldolase [Streptomyces sp. Act143]
MPNSTPRPDLDDLLADMGAAGSRISDIDASEAAAGNLSVFVGRELDLADRFPCTEEIALPVCAPALAGRTVLVTGSGRRLRDLAQDPLAGIGAVHIHPDGGSATLRTSPRRRFSGLTSEFNSHLAVHQDQVARRGITFQAVIHAQPPHLTYLSHIPAYRSTQALNSRILRWEPETMISLPQGVGVLDFMVPGSAQLMSANVEQLRHAHVVLWSKHGVMARSDVSVMHAVDRVEYVETGARYEYMDLVAGRRAEGLTPEEIKHVTTAFAVSSPWA